MPAWVANPTTFIESDRLNSMITIDLTTEHRPMWALYPSVLRTCLRHNNFSRPPTTRIPTLLRTIRLRRTKQPLTRITHRMDNNRCLLNRHIRDTTKQVIKLVTSRAGLASQVDNPDHSLVDLGKTFFYDDNEFLFLFMTVPPTMPSDYHSLMRLYSSSRTIPIRCTIYRNSELSQCLLSPHSIRTLRVSI